MADLHVERTDDLGKKDRSEDIVFLMTPPDDIHRRIDPEEFGAFVLSVDQLLLAQFPAPPLNDGLVVRIACGLLPNRKKLIDVQVQPSGSLPGHAAQLAQAIEQLPTPEVGAGPVAFWRQRICGGLKPQPAPPFLQFLSKPGLYMLDNILMEAGGIPHPSRSPWEKMVAIFRSDFEPTPRIAAKDIGLSLCEKLGRRVIVPKDRVYIKTINATSALILSATPQGVKTDWTTYQPTVAMD